jgi:tetratricopeptide (TPR) repeat protein
MQATLDVSWNRLSSEQKRAFQALTVFRGGFNRSAALAVAGADLSLLVDLVNKSWLSYERKVDRYHMHELLRQYGLNKLKSETTLEHRLRNRHSAYFCGLLKEQENDWFGARQQEAAEEVRKEIENIQRAWRWAASQADVQLLAKGHSSLGRFYALEMRRTTGQKAFRSAANGLSESLAHHASDDPKSLTLLSQVLGWLAHFTEELDQRQKLLSQSQEILDRVSATGQHTSAEQAFIFLEQSYATGKRDYKASIRFSNRALALFRELGDRTGEAEALKELGLAYRRLGRANQAYDALRENLDIRRQLDDPFGIAEAMAWLGIAALHQLKLKEAEQLGQQALELFRWLGNRYYEANALLSVSYSRGFAGEYLAARELIDQALTLERDFGLSINLWTHHASAVYHLHLGRYAEAKAEARYVLDISRQRGPSEEIGAALEMLGAIATVQGDLEQAKSY